MTLRYHADITLTALKRWLIAQFYDCVIVAALWMVALLVLRVPLGILWASLAGILQIVPGIGMVLALIGPALALLFNGVKWEDFVGLLIAYAVIAILDGLVLQPYLMKRQNRVPFWASLLAPIVLGVLIPFWGVLLAPPLLAIIWAYRGRKSKEEPTRAGQGIVLPPEPMRDSDRNPGKERRW
jgi:predicted PurR-regulated permease PerM